MDYIREYVLIIEFGVIDLLIFVIVMKFEDLDDGEILIRNLLWFNIVYCKCNCLNFFERGYVLVNIDDGDIYNIVMNVCGGNGDDSIVDDFSEGDMVLYVERFKLRGSIFYNVF